MAIGRISGRMLKDNLERDTSLTFNIDTLTIDYANSRVGVGTGSPSSTFHVNGDTILANLQITNNSISSSTDLVLIPGESGNIDVVTNNVTNVKDQVNPQDAATKHYIDLQIEAQSNLVGNLEINNTTITTVTPDANIIIDAESGILKIAGTTGVVIPSGTTDQRIVSPETGTMRWNSEQNLLEVYNGTAWVSIGLVEVLADTFAGNGSTVDFTLSESATADNIMVMLNGVVQQPTTAYTVTGGILTFTEAPEPGDLIDVRLLQTAPSGTAYNNTSVAAYLPTYTGNVSAGSVFAKSLQLDVLTEEPATLVNGMIVLADGITWQPRTSLVNPYPVMWISALNEWRKLSEI